MIRDILLLGAEWLFFGYFLLIYAIYAGLNVMAVVQIRRYLQIASLTDADPDLTEPRVRAIAAVPAGPRCRPDQLNPRRSS